MSIARILAESPSDKESPLEHSYGQVYENLLSGLKEVEAVLEIGVYKGDSLRAWKSIWPEAEVWGLDLNPECKEQEGEGLKVEILDAGDREQLQNFALEHPDQFSLIVDDGSHILEDQLLGLKLLWPTLKSGGYYVIEDVATHRNMNVLVDLGGTAVDLRSLKLRADDILIWWKKI